VCLNVAVRLRRPCAHVACMRHVARARLRMLVLMLLCGGAVSLVLIIIFLFYPSIRSYYLLDLDLLSLPFV